MQEKNRFSILECIWIFIIGCVIGYVIETLFYMIKYHYYVNKQGLLFGPFKPIYGTGTLLITIAYHMIRKKTKTRIFFTGVIIGTIFEYFASFILEILFKSYIWDYSNFNLNLNGRIYLPYCFIWGIIAVVWCVYIYPLIKHLYCKYIKNKHFQVLTVFLGIFMVINITLTGLVLLRQGYRNTNNWVFRIVDSCYPEEKIIKKFPKFRAIK